MDLNRKLEVLANEARSYIIEDLATSNVPRHIGGSLSCVDILIVLYFHILKISPQKPKRKDRDRFILSKGHAGMALYTVLAMKKYFQKSSSSIVKILNGIKDDHPCVNISGVDVSTGSLGQGLSVGVGMALGAKAVKKYYKVYVLLGDGEMNSGQVWEAMMTASKYQLDNLISIVDYNNLQVDGETGDVMPLGSLEDKCRSFGWDVLNVNGHDIEQIINVFKESKNIKKQPVMIIANTTKCKGIPFYENKKESHSVQSNNYIKEALIRTANDLRSK